MIQREILSFGTDQMVWTRPGGSLGEEVDRMASKVVGLDTAKHVFKVHGADVSGRAILHKRPRRSQIPYFFANLPWLDLATEPLSPPFERERRYSYPYGRRAMTSLASKHLQGRGSLGDCGSRRQGRPRANGSRPSLGQDSH